MYIFIEDIFFDYVKLPKYINNIFSNVFQQVIQIYFLFILYAFMIWTYI